MTMTFGRGSRLGFHPHISVGNKCNAWCFFAITNCVSYSFQCFTSLIHDFAGCSGIKQLLADEVYVAAYPLHEVWSLLFYVPLKKTFWTSLAFY